MSIEMVYGNHGELHNFREVDEKEFVNSAMRRIYNPQRMEYRQVKLTQTAYGNTREVTTGLTLHWYHNGRGDAILLDWHEKRARFFLFAECEHEMKHVTTLGRCFNRYTCSKCGYTEDVDSSD